MRMLPFGIEFVLKLLSVKYNTEGSGAIDEKRFSKTVETELDFSLFWARTGSCDPMVCFSLHPGPEAQTLLLLLLMEGSGDFSLNQIHSERKTNESAAVEIEKMEEKVWRKNWWNKW